MFTPKQKRVYKRVIQGCASHPNDRLRFLTLTTPPGQHDLYKMWKAFISRVNRKYGKQEYLLVKTSEGNGVIHALLFGSYLPRAWLQEIWIQIAGAWNIHISAASEVRQRTRISMYVVRQYMAGQEAIIRMSYSKGWIRYPLSYINHFRLKMREYYHCSVFTDYDVEAEFLAGMHKLFKQQTLF